MTEATRSTTREAKSVTAKEGKYLTFVLGNEDYAIGVLRVKEIIGMMSVTYVPQVPEFVKGVINLRGKVIPIIDLRLKFNMATVEETNLTCIIIVEINGIKGSTLMGIVVDAVSEVLNIKDDNIEKAPALGAQVETQFILGMAKMENGIKILLDIDRVLNGDEVQLLEQAAA